MPATAGGKIVFMRGGTSEVSDDFIKAFQEANKDVAVEVVEKDDTKLKAMFAAGTPPDLFRASGADVPSYAKRGLILDLSPYYQQSTQLKADDLFPAATSYFKYNGAWYGQNLGWSPDQSTLINKAAFDEVGLAIPEDKKIYTYNDMAEWARKLTKKDGDKTVRIGWAYSDYWDATIQTILMENGEDVFSEDFKKANYKDNKTAVDWLTFMAGLAKEGLIWSPTDPSPSWGGEDLTAGRAGALSSGYWMHGMVIGAKDVKPEDIRLYPALSWGGKKAVNPPLGGAAWFVAKDSKAPDAAWRLFEYLNASEPAKDRAKSGWGLPTLKSLMPLVPQKDGVDKQFYDTTVWEIDNVDMSPRRVNPYIETNIIGKSWTSNLERYLKGEIDVKTAIENLDADVNKAIADGVVAAGE